jgi:hypothetical protein
MYTLRRRHVISDARRIFEKKVKKFICRKLINLKQFIRGMRFLEVKFGFNYSILVSFNMNSVNEL